MRFDTLLVLGFCLVGMAQLGSALYEYAEANAPQPTSLPARERMRHPPMGYPTEGKKVVSQGHAPLFPFRVFEAPMSIVGQGTATISDGLDPTKWLGAWDFSASPSPNIVTAGNHGSAALSTDPGYGTTLSAGKVLYCGPSSAVDHAGGLVFAGGPGSFATTGLSFGFFLTLDDQTLFEALIASGITIDRQYFLGTNRTSMVFGLDSNVNSGLFVNGYHHYAFTWAAAGLNLYRDGALVGTYPVSGFPPTYAGGWSCEASSRTFPPPADILGANIVYYNGVWTASTVARLAAGAMPNAAGVLVAP